MIGAATAGIGYYTVICGQIKGDEEDKRPCDESRDSLDKKVPLLQENIQV